MLDEKITEVDENGDDQAKADALEALAKQSPRAQAPPPKSSFFSFGKKKAAAAATAAANDTEKAKAADPRGMRLLAPIYSGLAAGLSLCMLSCVACRCKG